MPINMTQAVESFEGRGEFRRLRLTAEEARYVRYVLSEWEGECGAASSMGAQLEKLAQLPEHAPVRRGDQRAWWEQTIYCPAPSPAARDVDAPQERYCAKKHHERVAILRAWHAIRAMAKNGESVAVLVALYGDTPPGMPARGLWGKDVDADYRRVCRYADGGSAWQLEARLHVDRVKRAGETADAHKARVAQAMATRAETLSSIARECEHLIVQASNAYRAAWRATEHECAQRVRWGGGYPTVARIGMTRAPVAREEAPVGLMGPVAP